MNALAKIAEESGLPQTKSQALLEIFQEFFGIAAEWEEQAKSIKVTDESQTDLMLKAREGRKFLQDARIKLEKTRVDQKKFALLEGKAIDGMANVLKASIIPVETYLKEQEDFVVNKKKAEAEAREKEAFRLLAEKEAAEDKALEEQIEKERLAEIKRRKIAEEEARVAQIEKDKAIEKAKKIDKQRRLEREAHQKEIEQKQAESDRIAKEAKLRNDAGSARQHLLSEIDIHLDFNTCANMKDSVWTEFYKEKTDGYQAEQTRIFLEKQRAEKEEKEKQEKHDKELAEAVEHIESLEEIKPTTDEVKCPSCGCIFKPELKLL